MRQQHTSDAALLSSQSILLDIQPTHGLYSLKELSRLTIGEIQSYNRLDIMLALRHGLARNSNLLSPEEVENLVALARYLCDWPILIKMQQLGLWRPFAEEEAIAEIQLGEFDRALVKVQLALSRQPTNVDLIQACHDIQQLFLKMPYQQKDLNSNELSLTPLSLNHLADFAWQYADTSIAERCNLPKFTSSQQWMAWMQLCQQDKHRHLFAVMHAEYGFIGSVSLQTFNDVGFFYYWIGTDFQGKGLGPRAVEILLTLAKKYHGLTSCYAKIFDYNKPSHVAINKLTFTRLPFTAKAPSESEVFYYRGAMLSERQHHRQLQWLLEQLKSDIELTPFLQHSVLSSTP